MDVGKQRNPKVHQILTQHLGLLGAPQRHRQGGRGGHGTYCSKISGTIVPQHFPGIFSGIGAGQTVQHGQPDIVTHHNNKDHDKEDGQLLGNGALISQAGKSTGNEEGQDGDDHPGDDIQHNALELLQYIGNGIRLGPGSRQTHQHRKYQSGHDAHDGINGQGKQQFRSIPQSLSRRLDGEAGDNGKARAHGHEGRTHGRAVRQYQSQTQHPGGIALQAGNGGGNKSDDN